MERPDSRLIRVFLSSTFVDFQEERSLLVQQVFPSLRRRARSREVEIVDVDLRWGVTAEQTERGETLPLCLGEIDRCRPYFISLLGERYGWVPPPDYYKPELLERQPWLKERMGGASVTELEILHGVLRNPEMAGHAFFYLRDPAYAQAQSEPGWVAENPAERQRLEALKDQIRTSGFPVAEGLPSPQAIAERIEADLWQLIESRFPEQEPADALERENRRHSDYRRARTGLYLGGGPAIEQLERWIADGEQRILITGESGAGKSALIANWMQHHQKGHPRDVVYGHHLSCSNDANAIRPLLRRMLDTASVLLLDHSLISEPIEVPEDWWDLTAKVAETLQDLGRWCRSTGNRWIWVLDGLDRLDPEEQKALPWLPPLIPEGVSVVVTALDCPARSIVQQRQFRLLQIKPLSREEQEQLIQRYLRRYTKQLDDGLRQRIVNHQQAGSPLFLRVLLEELRQCGRYETLAEQLGGYLQATSVADLYGLVLQRLEADGNSAALKAALTALWASRAGLPEAELLAITQLSPLQWAPIDLALQEALRHSGTRLVFGHDYLRQAVEMRYLPTEENRRTAHNMIADWFDAQTDGNSRKAEELPWQLVKANRIQDLISLLGSRDGIKSLLLFRPIGEAWVYWSEVEHYSDKQMEYVYQSVWPSWSSELPPDPELSLRLRDLLSYAGRHGNFALELSKYCVSVLRDQVTSAGDLINSMFELAELYRIRGDYLEGMSCCSEAIQLLQHDTTVMAPIHAKFWMLYSDFCTSLAKYDQAIQALNAAAEFAAGPDLDLCRLTEGWIRFSMGEFAEAELLLQRSFRGLMNRLGKKDSRTLQAMNNVGILLLNQSKVGEAIKYAERAWALESLNLGGRHWIVALYALNYGWTLHASGDYLKAEQIYLESLESTLSIFGDEHPMPNFIRCSLAWLEYSTSRHLDALSTINEATTKMEAAIGESHRDMAIFYDCLGWISLSNSGILTAIDSFQRSVKLSRSFGAQNHPDQIIPLCGLSISYLLGGDLAGSNSVSTQALDIAEYCFPYDHLDRALAFSSSAAVKFAQSNHDSALEKALDAASMRERILGLAHPDVLLSRLSIANIREGNAPVVQFTARRFSGGSFL